MRIPAAYFDGKTSRRYAVELMHNSDMLLLDGDIHLSIPFDDVLVMERVGNKTRKLSFPGGGYLEVSDVQAFDALMAERGYAEPLAVRMQHSWQWVLIALAILIAVTVPGYLYGLPSAAKHIAKRLPEDMQQRIGSEALSVLDKRVFQASALPVERQQAIIARFKSLTLPEEGSPTYEILFRKSQIGPNAFALPSGQIVMTDELVNLLDNDDAIMGVLAHELGHLHERHMLRRIIQGSVVGLASVALFGDVSSVVSAIPTAMLDMKYSRDAEREADNYAIAMMRANQISLDGLALTFEKLGRKSPELSTYLSTHPPAAERIARIKTLQSEAAQATEVAAANASEEQMASALTGEWRPDVAEWMKQAQEKGMAAENEAAFKESLVHKRIVFHDENRVHFDFSRQQQGEYTYTAKQTVEGCYELEIAELGAHVACISDRVMLIQNLKTGALEHYLRQ